MIDEDGDGLISFREFAQGLGIICQGETQDRMQFMYRMHVPPAISVDCLDISDAESVESCAELEESGISGDLTSPSCEKSQPHGISQARDVLVPEEKPIGISSKARDVHCENTKGNDKRGAEIPPMSQEHFIMLWKTLYSLFRELPNEQEMYQSIASVGNMLLKLGEFARDLDTNGIKAAEHMSKTDDLDRFMDPLHVAEFESSTLDSVDVSAGVSEVTVSTQLGSSSLVKEALIDAARSYESSLSSPVRSSNGEDFILVESDEELSSPEQVPSEPSTTQDTLHEVLNKLNFNEPSSPKNHSGISTVCGNRTSNPEDLNSPLHIAKREVQSANKQSTQADDIPSLGTEQLVPNEFSSGILNMDQSEGPSSGALDFDWSISFEQFLASMLTEPYLVHYFEETIDVSQRLKQMKTEGVGSFRTSLQLVEKVSSKK